MLYSFQLLFFETEDKKLNIRGGNMARSKKGIIYSLEQVLAQLLETNEALDRRLAQLESALVGGGVAGKRGRKPGRKGKKRGRKPGPQKTCSVKGCKRDHYAKGLCASHYQQKRLKEKGKKPAAKV
jgi:hypothetical protein